MSILLRLLLLGFLLAALVFSLKWLYRVVSSKITRTTQNSPMARRILLFLYSNGNIAGSLLGIIGMGLFFGGIIKSYWLAIVLGLYVTGVLAFPRSAQWQLSQTMRLEGIDLQHQLQEMLKKVRKNVGAEVYDRLQQLAENLDYLITKTDVTSASPFLRHFVQQTVNDYLPTSLENYLNLPPAYRTLHPVRNGKTSKDLLLEQLAVLHSETQEVIENVHQNDVDAIEAHTRFLKGKFDQEKWLD